MAEEDRSANASSPKDKSNLDENTAQIDYRSPGTPSGRPPGGAGFLHIYKPGQGYWTRMGTIASVVVVMILLGRLVWDTLDSHTRLPTSWVAGIVGGLAVASGLLLWRYLNKPHVVDFMIATESEMKKVNWTSKKELIGSTKVVIIFMFIIATVLFVIDIFFGYLFHWIHVLKYPPM